MIEFIFIICFLIGKNMTFDIVYPKDIETKRKEKNAIIVDVREPMDYKMGH